MQSLASPSLDAGRLAAEWKFSLDLETAAAVRQWARARMRPDPHGGGADGDRYAITTLYLDTAGFDVLARTGSYGRGKYRIRRYGAAPGVFLERKLKNHGRVGKRRTLVSVDQLAELDAARARSDWAGAWFHRRILSRALRPVCQIGYARTARMGLTEDGPIRLTLDEDLRVVPASGFAFESMGDAWPLRTGRVVLELKFRGAPPELFGELMAEFGLEPGASSKYRAAGGLLGFTWGGAPCLTFS